MPPVIGMNADTRIASAANCTSASHGWRSARRSVARETTLKAYVRPIRKKNGLTGKAPGLLIWIRIAEPSSSVPTTTRTAMSVDRRDRRSITPSTC
jgi:hypothetical protein